MADIRRILYSLKGSLESEISRYDTLTHLEGIDLLQNAKLQEDLRRYYAIRCAGFLEKLFYEAITWYIETNANREVSQFSRSFFKKSPNLTPDAMETLVSRFGEVYLESLNEVLDEELKGRLGVLLNLRNEIAHGDFPTGAKHAPEQYLELCNIIYDWILEQFIKNTVVEYGKDGLPLKKK
ncbi:hypothetical protein G6021_00940 [Dietzia sp. CW19]|uniref:HEPN domain-containing protein n=1 Tax=unclassified Dietzia TaxID=2617939 RepID=UPI0015F804E9|nr:MULTISPECIES: HEPN domain-containing protein [unclassified Dietzia]MBB1049707.1 hypothetical protein [Dietzia sp. CW19]MBB1056065.1 hypothetical protein [Dietzia sp. B19]